MTTRNTQMMIRISPEVKKRLEKAAKSDRMTMSEWVRVAVSDRLDERETQCDPKTILKQEMLECLNDPRFREEFIRRVGVPLQADTGPEPEPPR